MRKLAQSAHPSAPSTSLDVTLRSSTSLRLPIAELLRIDGLLFAVRTETGTPISRARYFEALVHGQRDEDVLGVARALAKRKNGKRTKC